MNWEDFQEQIHALSAKIDFQPDMIVGIVRGGMIPARFLSNTLKVKEVYCLTVEKKGGDRVITTELTKNVDSKRILLVEDMLESGRSLEVVRKYLETKGAIVKTACLYTMPITEKLPDYSLGEKTEVIIFPWDK